MSNSSTRTWAAARRIQLALHTRRCESRNGTQIKPLMVIDTDCMHKKETPAWERRKRLKIGNNEHRAPLLLAGRLLDGTEMDTHSLESTSSP